MTYPLVSILVPLYNHEDYIVSCLESVCQETYPSKELIIIDDGSPDNSAQRVRDWLLSREHTLNFPVKFTSRPNMGVSETLNELFRSSNGDFIAFLSSDDQLISGGIAKRMEYMEHHPEKLLVVGDYQVINHDGDILHESGITGLHAGRTNYLADDRLITGELIFHWSLAGPIYLFRRAFIEETGGYDKNLEIEDWDVCLRLAATNQIGFINSAVAAYRWHGNNTALLPEKKVAMLTALYATANKNRHLFRGLYWWHLLAYEYYVLLQIARCTRSPSRFYLTIAAKLRKITTALYERRVRITTPNQGL